MKTHACCLAAICLSLHSLHAVGGISPDWTDVADADKFLMGDYEGEWRDAPKGHYFHINKPLAAQVINVREDGYFLRFYQQHDARADTYFEGPGSLQDGEIRFSGDGWSGAVTREGFTGTGRHGNAEVRFELKKVTRSSPTLGMTPPPGAMVLFDGENFDHWQHPGDRPVSWHLTGDAIQFRNIWIVPTKAD